MRKGDFELGLNVIIFPPNELDFVVKKFCLKRVNALLYLYSKVFSTLKTKFKSLTIKYLQQKIND